MLTYALIGLSLVLLGVAGLQFTYMFYVERLYRERIRHTKLLERRNGRLRRQLDEAEDVIAEQQALLDKFGIETTGEDESWADLIDER